jgi:hypothetical protein
MPPVRGVSGGRRMGKGRSRRIVYYRRWTGAFSTAKTLGKASEAWARMNIGRQSSQGYQGQEVKPTAQLPSQILRENKAQGWVFELWLWTASFDDGTE